ncbi:MAG: hypothetical protein U9R36_02345 [Elusimicrobiota bacterium]|nr:hypothetical protein [Elusimicrobiota bacterium]
MKALFVVYNAAIESMVAECMKECGVKSYTKFPRIHGSGQSAGPRLDTHVWPGVNNALLIINAKKKISQMLDKINELKKNHKKEGLKAFVFPVEEII